MTHEETCAAYRACAAEGLTQAETATKMKLTVGAVNKFHHKYGVPFASGKRTPGGSRPKPAGHYDAKSDLSLSDWDRYDIFRALVERRGCVPPVAEIGAEWRVPEADAWACVDRLTRAGLIDA